MASAELYAPASYVNASPKYRAAQTNGCGPGGWKVDLVPDTLWGLNVTEECNIHDWMYYEGKTNEDKEKADRVLYHNLLRRITAAGGWGWLQWLRRRRAWDYYEAVKMFGGPAFWKNKNPEGNVIHT